MPIYQRYLLKLNKIASTVADRDIPQILKNKEMNKIILKFKKITFFNYTKIFIFFTFLLIYERKTCIGLYRRVLLPIIVLNICINNKQMINYKNTNSSNNKKNLS